MGDEVKKYLVNTLTPYRDAKQFRLAIYQPLRGLTNLFLAFLCMLITIILSLTMPLSHYSNKKIAAKNLFIDNTKHTTKLIILGLSQLITTPLTWLIQIPLRSLCNFQNRGWAGVELGYHMQRIVSEAERAIEQQDKAAIVTTIGLLHKKFQRNIKRYHRHSQTDPSVESGEYAVLDKDFILGTLNIKSNVAITTEQKAHLSAYLGLFKAQSSDKRNAGTVKLFDEQSYLGRTVAFSGF